MLITYFTHVFKKNESIFPVDEKNRASLSEASSTMDFTGG
jgi:hypothetical protein